MAKDTGVKSVALITMGCSKNLVDSERLMAMLAEGGINAVHDPECPRADLVVVNTCGFIGDAKEESINMILQCIAAKQRGDVRQVAVMGCLSQRYRRQLQRELPEVDRWYGKFDWSGLVSDITGRNTDNVLYGRTLTTPSHHAYIKISEGCNRFCAFCAIPLITGRHKSRSIDDIAAEVRRLVSSGVKEFNVIAQDLSAYGTDLYGRRALKDLLETIADIRGVEWIRLHYAYPAQFPLDILEVMAKRPNICKYLDIALQHASDKVLTGMRRHIDLDQTRRLLDLIRHSVPGIHIRTTLMTGFPGEGEEEFEQLLQFVREQRFERMGAFAYCEEEDTYAARHYADSVPDDVKQARLDRLMRVQEGIDLELAESKVGQTLRVICDGADAEFFVCRSQYDSPEVDPTVLVPRKSGVRLQKGCFYDVVITRAYPHDLVGELKAGTCNSNVKT